MNKRGQSMRIFRCISESKICPNGNKQIFQCGRSFKRFTTSDSCWQTRMSLSSVFSATVKIPNNIQFKKELVSAASQNKFCFTMYPIYSLRRAPAVARCSLYFVFFLHSYSLVLLVFTTLNEAVAGCSHPTLCTWSTVVSVGVPELFITVSISAHGDPTTGCQLLFFMCIDFMLKERQVLLLFNKITIIILPYIYINPLLSKSLKIFYGFFFPWI